MNLELAHTMLKKHGYCLETRDVKVRGRDFCHIIANSGYTEHFLCSMSYFALIGTGKFGRMIEPLRNSHA